MRVVPCRKSSFPVVSISSRDGMDLPARNISLRGSGGWKLVLGIGGDGRFAGVGECCVDICARDGASGESDGWFAMLLWSFSCVSNGSITGEHSVACLIRTPINQIVWSRAGTHSGQIGSKSP